MALRSFPRPCRTPTLRSHGWSQRRALSISAPRTSLLKPLKPHRELIDPASFAKEYLERGKPGHFPGLIRSSSPYAWPAFEQWPAQMGSEKETLTGLAENEELRDANVEVEIAPMGRGYGDAILGENAVDPAPSSPSSWTKINMPFALFLEAFISKSIPWSSEPAQDLVGYVAQQDLFALSALLRHQCPPLPHQSAGPRGSLEQWRRNVWIGGKGSFTPIHRDPYENLFVQVVGTKRVHLFPSRVESHLHLFPASSTSQPNTSQIPDETPLLSSTALRQCAQGPFPGLPKAVDDLDARSVVLEAGDVLFIPRGWLHCVASLSVSASVNAWFR